MSMLRTSLIFLALIATPLLAQPEDPPALLAGRVDGRYYISPRGTYRIPIPVLPELGGAISDTEKVVTFQDSFSVYISIGVFAQDATQRWELSTRGPQDYLTYVFSNYVLPDFARAFPGCRVESVAFSPGMFNGALIAYTLLPGGSMFAGKRRIPGGEETPTVAKRGNLIFVRQGSIYVISTELAERETERSLYQKTTAEEDAILRDRLLDVARKLEFARPDPAP
jgi:hypothetical protein